MRRTLLVEDNEGDLRLIQAAVEEVQDLDLELCHVSRLSDAVSGAGREKFDAVLLDLNLPDSQGMNTVRQMRQAAPDVPILVLTGLDDEDMAVRALQNGAQDYLVKGQFDGPQLARAIGRARARSDAAKPGQAEAAHKLIGVLGAKGGCGVTTVACHLATELSRQTSAKTLLADFDLVAGTVGFLMKATSQHSVLEAADMAGQLDLSSWRKLVSNVRPNLDILTAPVTLAGRIAPRQERLAHLLKFVRLNYCWGVVDLGRGLSEFTTGLLDHLDLTFIVITPDVLALARGKQIAETLLASGFPAENLRVIVNRMPESPQLTTRQIESVLNLPVGAALPYGPEQAAAFTVEGKLASPHSALGGQFALVAARLAGLEPAGPKRRWFSFWSGPAGVPPEASEAPEKGSAAEAGPARAAADRLHARLDTPRAAPDETGPSPAAHQLNRELARAKADLEKFACVAGHDLREPARVIAVSVQMLERRVKDKLDAAAKEMVATALDGVAQMLERLDGLVQFSRVNSRGAEFQPVRCQEALAQALSGLDQAMAHAGAVVTHDALPDIHGDGAQIQTVFHTLLANALTYRSEEALRVHVQAERSGGEWAFAVRDNGIGIAPQYAERIFDIFQRLHTRAERPGAGVGLAVTKRIVERHGGRIWVESEPGKGATFFFNIPDPGAVFAAQPVTASKVAGSTKVEMPCRS
ncbi:MAG: response regulator [Acidobacteriia bacterium]|nr:response regulator [Terriglobia bacterium]